MGEEECLSVSYQNLSGGVRDCVFSSSQSLLLRSVSEKRDLTSEFHLKDAAHLHLQARGWRGGPALAETIPDIGDHRLHPDLS